MTANRFPALAITLLAAFCVYLTPANAQTAAATGSPPATADYHLAPNDKVRVTVFGETTLSGEFQVGSSGSIAFPLIGDVPAKDQSATSLGASIQARLADGYLKNPRVSVEILTFRPFYVLGEVTKPGEYPYSDGLTVVNAIATAQGFTEYANRKTVFIKHAGAQDEAKVLVKDAPTVRPGDTIRVAERFF